MSVFKSRVLRRIISSSAFWRIRHLVQPKWVSNYAKANKNIAIIEDLLLENDIKSILDFGCASGRMLFKIKEVNPNIKIYGVDINKKAIKYCKNYADNNHFNGGYHFSSVLNKNELYQFLDNNDLSKFDLIVFDRVLYCLNERQIINIIQIINNISSLIYIDDFYSSNSSTYIGYVHRDWINIFKKNGYDCKVNIPTTQNKVQNADARSMVFKKNKE